MSFEKRASHSDFNRIKEGSDFGGTLFCWLLIVFVYCASYDSRSRVAKDSDSGEMMSQSLQKPRQERAFSSLSVSCSGRSNECLPPPMAVL